MTMSVSNLIGGPCRAFIDIAATLTEVGHLNGGVDLNIPSPAIMDLMADELGATPADGVFNGIGEVTAIVRLAEFTMANLDRGIPNSTLITDSVTPANQRLEIRAKAGGTLSAAASKWVFKPIDPATGEVTTDENKWLTIPKGVAIGAINVAYKTGDQRVLEVTLRCLPDTANNNRVAFFGYGTTV